MKRVCIVGGGIIGMMTAYFLLKTGKFDITIIDKNDLPGQGASDANAMQLTFGTAHPIASFHHILKQSGHILFDRGRISGAVGVSAPISREIISFLAVLGMTALPPVYQKTQNKLVKLASESKRALFEFLTDHPDADFYHRKNGKLEIYQTEREFKNAEKMAYTLNRTFGSGLIPVRGHDVYACEPGLEQQRANIPFGAVYTPDDHTGHAGKLARWIYETYKNDIRFLKETTAIRLVTAGRKITAVKTDKGDMDADYFIMAGGLSAHVLLSQVIKTPVFYPLKGYAFDIDHPAFSVTASVTEASGGFAMATYGHYMRITGLMDFDGHQEYLNSKRIAILKQKITEYYPHIDLSMAGIKTGLRPALARGYPAVGGTSLENLYMNYGHGMYGWTLSFGTAKYLADIMYRDIISPLV